VGKKSKDSASKSLYLYLGGEVETLLFHPAGKGVRRKRRRAAPLEMVGWPYPEVRPLSSSGKKREETFAYRPDHTRGKKKRKENLIFLPAGSGEKRLTSAQERTVLFHPTRKRKGRGPRTTWGPAVGEKRKVYRDQDRGSFF